MIFNLSEQNIFFILFFILAGLIIAVCLDIFRLLRKKEGEFPLPKDFAKNGLFLKISEDFQKKLEGLIGQEIQKAISEFSQQASNEIPNLSKFSLEAQKKFSENAENKISELNQTAKKELAKIQEINLKAHDLLINEVKGESAELLKDIAQKFSQIYQSTSETLNKKVVEAESEIENYKKERFKEINRKIYQMIGEVAKKTIGKTIDLSEHEKLVIEALEKAKKEIFF